MPEYQQPVERVVVALGTDSRRGLTVNEARARLERYGANELASSSPVRRWRRFLAQFEDVLVVLLLVASAISAALWLYERDTALPFEAIAISAIVLLNAVIGYVQEARAETAIAALRADVGRTGACDSRRRSADDSRLRAGARRPHPDRSGRHRPCRRSYRRVVQPADFRGGADGRKPSSPEGFRGRLRAMSPLATASTWCSRARR